jgi:hypothetical protein
MVYPSHSNTAQHFLWNIYWSCFWRPDSTGAFSRRNAKYFACFFWIVKNQVEIIYSSSRNSRETGEIIRISPRKSARGIRPWGCVSITQSSLQTGTLQLKRKAENISK